jgi:hypothetical protein
MAASTRPRYAKVLSCDEQPKTSGEEPEERSEMSKKFVVDYVGPTSLGEWLPVAAVGVTAQDFAPGEGVQVHAFGHWYYGTVVSIGRTKVKVNYTSGTGVNRDKNVGMDKIRKRDLGVAR